MTRDEKPLDITFNCAVRTIAGILFPCGYHISEHAPQTYNELVRAFDANKPVVWSGASEQTIYGCSEANWAFRAWHDWCHWKARLPFTFEGETAVYHMQCRHLEAVYGKSVDTERWCRILYAEVVGQQLYAAQYGTYPEDQRAFVQEFLRNPSVLAAAA